MEGDLLPPEGGGKVAMSTQLILLSCNAAVGGFMYGYDTGSMGGALLQLKRPRTAGACPGLDDSTLSVADQELIVSAVVLGGLVTSTMAGWLSASLGRRNTILIASVLLIVGSSLMSSASTINSMLVARFITGAGIGITSCTVPMYICECSPSSHRGRLCFLNDMMIVFGQVFAALTSTIFFQLEVNNSWRYILGLGTLPGMVMFFGFFLQPESPRWLLSMGRQDDAKSVLALLRGSNPHDAALEAEFQEMSDGITAECKATNSGRSCFQTFWLDLHVRRALMLGCGLQILQQWSGINTIMYYGATIMQRSGDAYDVRATTCFTAENKRDVASTVIFSVSQIVGVLASWFLVDRIGRRPLILTSLAGVVLSLAILGCVFTLANPSSGTIVFFIVMYTVSFGFGLSPVPWTVNAEIYPVSVRGTCVTLATSMHWLMNLVVTKTFLSWATSLSTNREDPKSHPNGIFWVYSAVAAVGTALVWAKMPETRGVQLEDVGRLFVRPDEFRRA